MVADNQFASIDFNTAATQTVIAAPSANQRIYVVGYFISNGVATAQTLQFRSGSSNLSGVVSLPSAVGGGAVMPLAPPGRAWFFCAPGTALTMVQSAATQVAGHVAYVIA